MRARVRACVRARVRAGGVKYLISARYKRLQLNVSTVVENTVTKSVHKNEREGARARTHTHTHTHTSECPFVRVHVCVSVSDRE